MALELILVLLFTPAVILFILWFLSYSVGLKYLGRYPAPPTYPLVGNAFSFSSNKKMLQNAEYLLNTKNTKVLRINIGLRNGLLIKDYKLLESILSSNSLIDKGKEYRFFHPWLGTGLLTSGGSKWRQRRKIITPSFHFNILQQFVNIFDAESNVLVEKLRSEVGNNFTDIYPFIALCTLDIICKSAMGTSVNAQSNPNSPYVDSVKTMNEIVLFRSFRPIYHSDFCFQLSSTYRKQENALKILHEYTDSVISKRRKQIKEVVGEQVDESIGKKKRATFLDTLMSATINDQLLTDEDIREEVDTFMFTGHDTTSTGISFVLYCLSNHPEVQQKVYNEISWIFGDDLDRPTTYEDLMQMKYLEMVIQETLRLYSVVPIIFRETMEEIKFEDLTIPKNFCLCVFIYGMHRDPEYFPNPEVFDPERFSENKHRKLPYAYIPFSAGPRNCIGQKYGMLKMKEVISKILKHYILKPTVPVHKMDLSAESILKSDNGVRMRLVLRRT